MFITTRIQHPFVVILATEQQLDQLIQFTTDGTDFTVLCIDPTFSLGIFYCTPITIKNFHLSSLRHGQEPIALGPIMIHLNKDYASYSRFMEELVRLRPKLRDLISYGTDGEEALSKSVADSVNGDVVHLRCFNHVWENVNEVLKKAGVTKSDRRLFKAEIFDDDKSLVNSNSEAEFDARFATYADTWKVRDASGKLIEYIAKSVR